MREDELLFVIAPKAQSLPKDRIPRYRVDCVLYKPGAMPGNIFTHAATVALRHCQ